MPFTTIYGDGTRVVGDGTTMEQALHPSVMNYISVMKSSTGGNYDMSVNEIDAVNNMVQAMVANGIWSKMKALYPIIGGTAATHKYNLVDPRDVDAAFRLNFIGGWTHTSNGMTSNGTTGYADTFLTPSTSLSQNSTHVSCYIRTNNTSNEIAMGTGRTTVPAINIFPNFSALSYFRINSGLDSGVSTGNSNLGLFLGNRISSTQTRNQRNAVRYVINTASTGLSTRKIQIATGLDSGGFYSNQFAFVSIGDGLSDAEARAFYIIVQAFQTKLGRQV